MKEPKQSFNEKLKDVIGAVIFICVLAFLFMLIQDSGFFDGMGSEPAPMNEPGDSYLHGEGF